ncbi:MAG: Ig-like domain-containing protein [Symbiopectobacterium sp.]|uniref:Ig-like domain-containing protein n=1 Tax=Symbiopectobacterium sp. TaxID=2952789 RepID=UPI0039E84DB7
MLPAQPSAISRLAVEANNAVANGEAANAIKVTATDAGGNRVSNVQIHLRADNGATISSTVLTDAQGEARVSLTSTRAGNSTVTANINGSDAHQVTLVFQPDRKTAHLVYYLPQGLMSQMVNRRCIFVRRLGILTVTLSRV